MNKIDTVIEAAAYASSMTAARLAEFPRSGVYLHAREQILKMQRVVNASLIPTELEKSEIDIGLMAIKELESEEPEYAAALIYLAARFTDLKE